MEMMKLRSLRWTAPPAAALVAAACWALLSPGCNKSADNAGGPVKLKVAYLGLTCEAPIFVAQEKGFYKEEGLDVELVKTDWNGLRQGLGSGNFDANHTLIMYLLQPIAEGLDIKITGGIHTGCLRVLTAANSDVKKIEDLKGKKVAVPTHLLSPPHMFATRVVHAHGMDPKKDVEWTAVPPEGLGPALERGDVAALATTDPIGTILIGTGKYRVIADQAEDAPYKDEYCCAAVVSGKLVRDNPAAAAKVTRALLKAAKWVQANATAAAELSVEKKYLASSAKVNAVAIGKLNYLPGVDRCRKSIFSAADEMKKAGLLRTEIETEELAKRAWQDLDGVTDAWVGTVVVERVPGGRELPPLDRVAFAALLGDATQCRSCCSGK
jgi:NitT/TauT family transport system substrate-binding protein